MNRRRLLLVDAFTDTPFTGNPAGVVPEAAGLTDRQMQAIAREVHASETAFVCGGGGPDPFQVRFFTPTDEVPLCGHATVAAFHTLYWEGRLPQTEGEWVVHQLTGAGPLPLRVKVVGDRLEAVLMGQHPPMHDPYRGNLEELAGPLGVPREALEEGDRLIGPPARVTTGLRCLHVALSDRATLQAVRPDFRALSELSRRLDVTTVQVFTLQSDDPSVYACARTFAPVVGVDEDPVTGTAGGSLGGYLAWSGLLPEGGDRRRFRIAQGTEMGRPGHIEVELQLIGASVAEVWVGGRAVQAFEGQVVEPL
jgi:PhzF family phenazine biosynthesis protein